MPQGLHIGGQDAAFHLFHELLDCMCRLFMTFKNRAKARAQTIRKFESRTVDPLSKGVADKPKCQSPDNHARSHELPSFFLTYSFSTGLICKFAEDP